MSWIVIAVIVTAVFSIIIAVLLARISSLSGEAKLKAQALLETQDTITKSAVSSAVVELPFEQAVEEEIRKVADAQKSQAISAKLRDIIDQELDQRVNKANAELSKRYEATIEEKTKDQEMIWNKYNSAVEEKKETEAVIHSIAEGLVVVGSDGKVMMMNPAAEKLLGISRKEKIGKPLLEGLKDEQLVSLVKETADGKEKDIELNSTHDETKKILRASSAVVENERGQTVGMVSVLSDITKQRELERLKSNFVASVTHELRTPLIAIDKSLALILNKTAGSLTENQEQFLTIAERNLKRLGRLIDDLLDMSKLEAGRMELKRRLCAPGAIVSETIAALDQWAKTKSIILKQKIPENLPEINIDPDRVTQVLTNLIGNAIKFTPPNGSITVEAAWHQDKKEMELGIRDTGPGIPKEHIGRIFDKFYQVKGSLETGISGTGLGLTIVKELVELHGGKVWVESASSGGTKFTFTLPMVDTDGG